VTSEVNWPGAPPYWWTNLQKRSFVLGTITLTDYGFRMPGFDFTNPLDDHVCEHAGAKMRLNHSWNKLDFVAMAKKAGAIGRLIVPGYYFPLRHAHPTFGGLTERLEIVDETMSLKADAQPDIADRSLMTAHNCILDAIKVQSEHFKITGLEDAVQVCYRDFLRVWSPDSPLLRD